MKPLNTFLDSKYSRLMTAEYGDQLQSIEPHIFSHMLRALKKHETQEEKIAFLLRVRDRPKALEPVQDLAQLGLFMKADDLFHELLREYGIKLLSHFVSTDFSKLMCEEYGEHLQCIESHIFFNMLRGLKRYETRKEKILLLLRISDRPLDSSGAHDLAKLGISMQASEVFHELLKEYDRES